MCPLRINLCGRLHRAKQENFNAIALGGGCPKSVPPETANREWWRN